MRTCELGSTGVRTTVLGFGCAGVFRLPRAADRASVLGVAYDAGVRHFDVAPMYGLGLAEPEFGRWARGKDDVVVATKFGIDPTAVGRFAGRVQGPVRSVLAARPGLDDSLKTAGKGPTSGSVGRVLYTTAGYTPRAAAAGLDRSLRALGRDHVDVLFLHDPMGDLRSGAPELIAHLEAERSRGRIRAWGVAGEQFESDPGLRALQDAAPVLQFRDDVFEVAMRLGDDPGTGRITFGAFGRPLGAIRRFLRDPAQRLAQWSDRVGTDLGRPDALPGLLLREALRRNGGGPVLFTSTKTGHIRAAADAVAYADPTATAHEIAGLAELVAAVRRCEPGSGGAG